MSTAEAVHKAAEGHFPAARKVRRLQIHVAAGENSLYNALKELAAACQREEDVFVGSREVGDVGFRKWAPLGDVGDPWGIIIERKEVGDFSASLTSKDNRMREQTARAMEMGIDGLMILVVEGDVWRPKHGVPPLSLFGGVCKRHLKGKGVMITDSVLSTATLVFGTWQYLERVPEADAAQRGFDYASCLRGTGAKRAVRKENRMEVMLSNITRISPESAKVVSAKFKSISILSRMLYAKPHEVVNCIANMMYTPTSGTERRIGPATANELFEWLTGKELAAIEPPPGVPKAAVRRAPKVPMHVPQAAKAARRRRMIEDSDND